MGNKFNLIETPLSWTAHVTLYFPGLISRITWTAQWVQFVFVDGSYGITPDTKSMLKTTLISKKIKLSQIQKSDFENKVIWVLG